ncbi:MAG: Aspartyl/glutamyl-tRNA(Asn/Gln) amidotransferase subunit B [Parcubacteria group bacterium GW2011_GWC1_43_11]|nr:MAG: Aspartyl/glutamyl-tRNA(Asn/Gln) amidotransferase subunit B [Parcubacteria group bacterium GW2011_GWC1_43_11]
MAKHESKYEPVIGLEIHTELKTKTKMFCASKNDPDERHPNINICPICTGQPGTLPVINQEAVNKVIKVGLALQSKISEITKWDRKNYFYPDLPKGYQISQYDEPICLGGKLLIPGTGKEINITRIHLEEDTGRLLHEGHIGHSLVDFNRAGVPLMELVTEPDLNSGEEASAFAQELQLILRYLGVSDADMEKGQLRVEANISLRESVVLGTKVEIKNLNSFKAVRDAIDYEIKRQAKLIDEGKKVVQETRGWNEDTGKTISQRGKEESHDYRYFPEPDLPPLKINFDLVEEIKTTMPELPSEKRSRFNAQYGLSDSQITILVGNEKLAGFFENVVSEFMNWDKEGLDKDSLLAPELDTSPHFIEKEKQLIINLSANYLLSDFLGLLNESSAEIDDIKITAENFAEWACLIHRNVITSRAAKEVLKEMWATGKDPSQVIREKDLVQVKDSDELEKVAQKIIDENSEAVSDYKKGKTASLQFLVGQVMKETRGKANPESVSEILKKLLK